METQEFSAGIRYAIVTIQDRKAFLAALHAISDRHGTHIVCFDADNLAGRQHAEKAVRFARRAIAGGTAISHSFEMEALLYAGGTRQCSAATRFGLHDGENRLYVCCCPDVPVVWQELLACMEFVPESPGGLSPEKAARVAALFGVSPAEIAAAGGDCRLPELILERVALLEVSK